tara:strand:+ start:1449 stop:1982 length:534 start_codon:yes stop_codon:yes gene_type:complete
MNYTNHLLSKYKILKSFNITKRVSPSYLKKITEELKKSNPSINEYDDEVYNLIVAKNNKDIDVETIPGIILNNFETDDIKSDTNKSTVQQDFNNLPYDKQKSIIQLAATIIDSVIKFELNSLDIFFFIQIIFNELKIEAEDMKYYNEKYSTVSPDDSDEYEEDDEEDEEDDDDDFKF